ncbi:MAG: sulfotransferase domain-containing protein [Candidatus Scalinduaceae bacterium]
MPRDGNKKNILFIVGCQRSGTSLLARIFERDFNTKVYGEFSKLSSNSIDRIRLNALSSVKETIDKDKVPLVILKPIVETQNVLELVEYFEGSKALWIYRYYKDVASSILNKFKTKISIENLRPIVKNHSNNWRSEKVSEYTRKIVVKYFSESMNPNDASALFWFVRNRLFFELNLVHNPNVMMCRYEDLVTNPTNVMKKIYEFSGCKYPGEEKHTEVHSKSIGRGKKIDLIPEIDVLCNELYEKLNNAYLLENNYSQ